MHNVGSHCHCRIVFELNNHQDEITNRDWYVIAEQPAPAPHLARPEGRAALRIVLVTVPRVNRSCENFPDGFDLHLLPSLHQRETHCANY